MVHKILGLLLANPDNMAVTGKIPKKSTASAAKKDNPYKQPSPLKASASSLKVIDTQSLQKKRALMKFYCARVMDTNCIFICVQDGLNPPRDAYLHGIFEQVRAGASELSHLNLKAIVCLRNGAMSDTPARNPNGYNRRAILQINDEAPTDEMCLAVMDELCKVCFCCLSIVI
jgi:hypothetical protein